MITSLIIIDIFIVIFGFISWKDYLRGKYVRLVSIIHFSLLFGSILCILLVLNSYRIRGAYTHLIIGTSYLCSAIILYAVTRSITQKAYLTIILIPLIFINIGLLGPIQVAFPAVVPLTFFDVPEASCKIDADNSIEIREALLGPQPTYLCKRKLILFNKLNPLRMVNHEPFNDNLAKAEFISPDSIRLNYVSTDKRINVDTGVVVYPSLLR